MAETNHTIIVFDNRGTGQTNVGTKTFSIRQFPDYAAGLLDALHIKGADIPGTSLGSFVAQELALNYPNKVDKLILSATYCGGNRTVYPSGKISKNANSLHPRYIGEHDGRATGHDFGFYNVPSAVAKRKPGN